MNSFLSLTRLAAIIVATLYVELSATSQSASRIDEIQAAYNDRDSGRVLIVAHRGCWSAAPENSIASLEACIRLGVETVEIDVQMTADGQLVVFHDRTLNRMTASWGYVAEKTLDELTALHLYERDGTITSAHKRPLLTRHKIASLEDVFEAARGDLMINLEIKSNAAGNFSETFNAAADLARKMGVADHIFWKIPSPNIGTKKSETSADANLTGLNLDGLPYIMPIIWQSPRGFEQQLADFSKSSILDFEVIGQQIENWPIQPDGRIYCAERHRYMGIAVSSRWSAGLADDLALRSPDDAWGRLIELGFDLIMTDRPEQLILYLEERSLR